MREPHLLRVEEAPPAFADLVRAIRDAGLRVGWLELGTEVEIPERLAGASELEVLRAVAVGRGRSVAVKPRRGQAVLGDVLREHFLGCRLVLVWGAEGIALLEPGSGGWRVTPVGGAPLSFRTEELVAALRKPRPWPRPGGAEGGGSRAGGLD